MKCACARQWAAAFCHRHDPCHHEVHLHGLQQWTPEVDRADPVELARRHHRGDHLGHRQRVHHKRVVLLGLLHDLVRVAAVVEETEDVQVGRHGEVHELLELAERRAAGVRRGFAGAVGEDEYRLWEHVIRGNHRRLLVLSLAGSLLGFLGRRCGGYGGGGCGCQENSRRHVDPRGCFADRVA